MKIRQCVFRDCQYGNKRIRDYHRSINRVMMELDDRSRRHFAGLLARKLGIGGASRVHEIIGLSRVTIRRGAIECESGQVVDNGRIRRHGGGRVPVEKKILKLFKRSMSC